MTASTLGAAIRAARQKADMTQAQLAAYETMDALQ